MTSSIRFNERDFDDLLKGMVLTDNQKTKSIENAANEMLARVKEGTPVDEGDVQKGWVKHKSKGGYVITNDYEDQNGDRIPFILEHKEGKSQGFFSRAVEENMDDIEEMILRDLEKNIKL